MKNAEKKWGKRRKVVKSAGKWWKMGKRAKSGEKWKQNGEKWQRVANSS